MSDSPDVAAVRRLHAHRAWSHGRLRAACRGLTPTQLHEVFEIGMGSVWETLVHLYAAEHAWLDAVDGVPSGALATGDDLPTWARLDAAWAIVDERWRALFDGLAAADLARPIAKRRVMPGAAAGAAHHTALLDVLLHVCTHAQYTTAQCINMLRRLGIEPLPDVQLIRMARDEASG